MPDDANTEKRQAEALSAAIDRLNQGLPPDNSQEEQEIAELLYTARLIKTAVHPSPAPPAGVLNHIVEQVADTIAKEKRKKRLSKALGFAGAIAAAAVVAFLYIGPQTTQEQQLAQHSQSLPAPAVEAPQPPTLAKAPPNLVESPTAQIEQQVPDSDTHIGAQSDMVPEYSPSVALGLSPSPMPADGETMLALADRKADIVIVDAVSKTIRQVYRKGAPDEIILTQAPKPQNVLRSAVTPPAAKQNKLMVAREAIDAKIKTPDRNKVTVTIDDKVVTLEGALSQEELLALANTLTKVSVAQEK
jgi:hypothetical protein